MRVYENKGGKRYSRPARHYEELRMKYGYVPGNILFALKILLYVGFLIMALNYLPITDVWKIVIIVVLTLYMVAN